MSPLPSNRIVTAPPSGRVEPRGESGTRSDEERIGLEGGAVPPNGTARARLAPPAPAVKLTGDDRHHLDAVLAHELATNTKASYQSQWRRFVAWAEARGVRALPAAPAHVAAYLAERLERDGHRPATLRLGAAALAFIHRVAGQANPCAAAEVRRVLYGATRKAGKQQKQAPALTEAALAQIRATAYEPRRGRGGWRESRKTAQRRGQVDLALISLMRDALLRISEAAALTWADIEVQPDGTGRLHIRRSKTDPAGAGAIAFLAAPTMALLDALRARAAGRPSVFGLHRKQIAKRIKRAAQDAGLGDRFSGHSPRVGMARDLARAGIELPRLMTAGRWRSPDMPALYIRNETAGQGAVAQFYGRRRTPAAGGAARTAS